ncbi:T7SS effector LXG polymorphic toxin [Lactococcus allomyrinae]|uniref:LXG domain-containing protein n=1 Tax=Lactococcus allomyrinae TaxID=2419773 RepID=A0A387B9Q9_9LACT|nr:T7SS effector LXG polymorphic toxin [Lactococcus allomyrinae]AYG00463.1 hypothetical protein D7I46_04785 [Lactococcus allomyrinae]
MGMIYSSSDSQNLMDGMNANLAIAKAAVQDVVSASRTLTGAIGAGKLLDGAAFNAGKDLFSALIIPTITRASSAFDDTKKHLSRYESANNEVSSEGVLDEDKLNAKKTSTQAIKTATDNTASTFRTISSAADSVSLPFVGPMLNDAAQNLENYSESLQQDIDKINQKLQKLYTFNSAVNGLFNDDLNQLNIVVQSVTVLSDTVVKGDGSYSLPKGTDASWLTSLKTDHQSIQTLKDIKQSLVEISNTHKGSLSGNSFMDWLEVLVGNTEHAIDEYTIDKGWSVAFPELFENAGGELFKRFPFIGAILDWHSESENEKNTTGDIVAKVGIHTVTNLLIDGGLTLVSENPIFGVGVGTLVEVPVDKYEDDEYDHIKNTISTDWNFVKSGKLENFVKDNFNKAVSNAFSPNSVNWNNENDNQRAGDLFSWAWRKLSGQN